MNSLEMWSFEMMVLLSGLLPNPKLETSVLSIWLVLLYPVLLLDTLDFFFFIVFYLHEHNVVDLLSLNTAETVWMVPFGFSGAVR